MTTMAREVEGVPTVSSTAERALRFPEPADGQKVFNRGTGNIEEYKNSAWRTVVTGSGGAVAEANVLNFGAVGDGVVDDYAAFVAAHDALPEAGGIIRIPVGSFRLSQAWNLTKPVHVLGTLSTSHATDRSRGSVLRFDFEVNGIIINRHDTLNKTKVADFTNPGANKAIIEGIVVTTPTDGNSLGTADVDGITMRAHARILNCKVLGFKRDGIRIYADITSPDPELYGNANTWLVVGCELSLNGRDGLHVEGGDTNAGLSMLIDSSSNGRYGLYEGSLIGNTHLGAHFAENAAGAVRATGATNNSILVGCYEEAGAQPDSIIDKPSMIIGGVMSQSTFFSNSSTGLVAHGSGVHKGAGIQHQNTKGTKGVGAQIGYDDTSMTAIAYGADEEAGGSFDAWKWTYSPTQKFWSLVGAGAGSRHVMSHPALGNSALRAFAMLFSNGIYLGGNETSPLGLILYDSAPPASGSYLQGDRVYNSTPSATRPSYWECTADGTPGTWVPRGLPAAKYTKNTTAGATTAAAGDMTGAGYVSAEYSAVGAANLTTRTATEMFGDVPGGKGGVGLSYILEIINTSGGTTTLVAGSGVTLFGTMTMATNTTRRFVVTFISATAVEIQSVGVGTIS